MFPCFFIYKYISFPKKIIPIQEEVKEEKEEEDELVALKKSSDEDENDIEWWILYLGILMHSKLHLIHKLKGIPSS